MTERNIAGYIRSRGIKGGEIILVKQLAREGKTDTEIDYALLEYGSEEVARHLHYRASVEADALEGPANKIEIDVANGEIARKGALDAAARLRKKASYIRLGLKKIFPDL